MPVNGMYFIYFSVSVVLILQLYAWVMKANHLRIA